MRPEHVKAGPEGVEETVAPAPRRHRSRARGVLGRELVVERQHDRLLAREVAVEQPDADARLRGHVAQRRLLPAPRRDEPDRRLVEAPSGLQALRRSPTWPAATAR